MNLRLGKLRITDKHIDQTDCTINYIDSGYVAKYCNTSIEGVIAVYDEKEDIAMLRSDLWLAKADADYSVQGRVDLELAQRRLDERLKQGNTFSERPTGFIVDGDFYEYGDFVEVKPIEKGELA